MDPSGTLHQSNVGGVSAGNGKTGRCRPLGHYLTVSISHLGDGEKERVQESKPWTLGEKGPVLVHTQ